METNNNKNKIMIKSYSDEDYLNEKLQYLPRLKRDSTLKINQNIEEYRELLSEIYSSKEEASVVFMKAKLD
jgi:hypothetical protein